ncbi:hypothetical protein [Caballeronia sp. LZ034LL]|uniref:DUF7940 domain-containing protein n=1 Tax=Caballeronia sp. LZ034LL TaxID=3038567 RepID=UPI002861587A|nr:hypothetical protein [Caballeronia sp. LZ034LL]MDR5839325.1 hypothetical protein [Caballeronia sp. LZ034LL]
MALINIPLVPDAKDWWKWYCTHALALAGGIPAAFASMPQTWQDHCHWMLWGLAPFVAISGVIGRVIDQPKLDKSSAEESSTQQQ